MSDGMIASKIDTIRSQFPALQRKGHAGQPCVYFDAPGGTQVPAAVIEAMKHYLSAQNSNTHGQFITSEESDQVIEHARELGAAFIGAPGASDIHFGANMSTITFHLSRALLNMLSAGDEIIITRLDHDANISPWLALQKFGIQIKWVDFNPENCTLKMDDFGKLLSDRTRLVAVGYASNAVGTINDAKSIVKQAKAAGALTFIDAVHFAPHGLIDVKAIDCDFLVCSAYKFFGPHIGMAYVRKSVADILQVDRVRPQNPLPPEKFETGTLNHEGIAGFNAAMNYLASLSQTDSPTTDVRQAIVKSMAAISAYEQQLSRKLITGLQDITGVKIYGIADLKALAHRTPTVSITIEGHTPQEIAHELGKRDIFVWDGDFYAVEVIQRLGLEKSGGLVRIGLTHYSTTSEIDRLLAGLREIAR